MVGYAIARDGEMEATLLPTRVDYQDVPASRVTLIDANVDTGTGRVSGVLVVLPDHRTILVHHAEIVPLQFASLMEGFVGVRE